MSVSRRLWASVRRLRHARQIDRTLVVAVPVLARDRVGVVRMGERDAQEERPPVRLARPVREPTPGGERRRLVEVELVRGLGDARLLDARHVVVPPVDPLVRLIPVRRPAEIGRIDVGGQPLLEAVQLVRADEMHLAGEAGAITQRPQAVRHGRHGGAELGGIVVDLDPRGQPPAHQRSTRRRAQREIAVGGLEHHALRRQPVEMRGADHRMAVGTQRQGGELVGHDHQDVRLGHRALFASGLGFLYPCLAGVASRLRRTRVMT